MGFRKCPRCELNYIRDDEELCQVCRREIKGERDNDITSELCTACGERRAVPGSEFCLVCLKEMQRPKEEPVSTNNDEPALSTRALDIDMVSDMEEIQIDDIGDDIPKGEFDEMESEFGSDDDQEDEDDDSETRNDDTTDSSEDDIEESDIPVASDIEESNDTNKEPSKTASAKKSSSPRPNRNSSTHKRSYKKKRKK